MSAKHKQMAALLQRQVAEHGETPLDVAQALSVYPTTVDRWLRGDRMPQRRHRKELAEHWGLPLDTFELDLPAEEERVRTQLERIEGMLKRLLEASGLATGLPEDDEPPDAAPRPADLIPPGDQRDAEGGAEQS